MNMNWIKEKWDKLEYEEQNDIIAVLTIIIALIISALWINSKLIGS